MNVQTPCPDEDILVALLDCDLNGSRDTEVADHVSVCKTCQQCLETLVTRDLRSDLEFDQLSSHLCIEQDEPDFTLAEDLLRKITDTLTSCTQYELSWSLDFLAPSDNPASLGRLGQYEIIELIGRGGMGIVLKGRDNKLERVVAVKVLAPELATNSNARRRFLREAKAAASINHDHLVTVHAVESGELPYLVMEYIDGCSLQEKVDREGMLETKEILRIGMQTAQGLAAAHEQGLIHHDIKPANILLRNGVERVQITDFGLARAVDDVAITRTGEIRGTPQYMSPEQARGEPTDQRSDLFSLGAVLYAMCAGRAPFHADSTMGVLHRVCNDSPRPIRDVNPDIADWLISIIDRLLEKRPEDRFQTAAEVADTLSQCLAHVQQPGVATLPALPPSATMPHRDRRKWYAGIIVPLVLIVGLGMSESTGFSNLSGTVLRIASGEGTLVIKVDDPTVEVSLDDEVLTITGAGVRELTLRPGQYQFRASKNGQPLKQELVTITRGGEQVVSVTHEWNDVKRPSRSSDVEAPDQGFINLFDGESLAGWQGHTGAFAVEDGAVVARARGNLFTTEEFSDFILEFEFRLGPAANCGIAIRSPLADDPAYTGFEVQILDDSSYYDLPDYCRHGSIWGVVAATPGSLKYAEQWNHQVIRCAGSEVQVTLNGDVIVDVALNTIDGPADGRDHPGLTRESGHIGLMSARAQVEFRNIRIKKLVRSRPRASEMQNVQR